MTKEEYCEIMDKSNFLIDSANPYDMEIKEALEKQIPIKPIGKTNICPKCGVIEFGYNEPNYCEWCGQKIKW